MTAHGGYSLAAVEGEMITLAGVPGARAPEVVIYSGPPVVEASEDGDTVCITFSGLGGRFTPVQVFGVTSAEEVETQACDAGLSFQARGGTLYRLPRH